MKRLLRPLAAVALATIFQSAAAQDTSPDCGAIEHWATRTAYQRLKNEGLIEESNIDYAKTRTARIASEKIGPDRYRQVHHVTFAGKDGRETSAVTVNDASHVECSMTSVLVFVVSNALEQRDRYGETYLAEVLGAAVKKEGR